MKTSTRTLRLIAATAAALVLMTAVAQARPLTGNGPAAQSQNTPLMTPLGNVPDRVDKLGTAQQQLAPIGRDIAVRSTSTDGGFDWTAAAIGAGTALLVVVVTGAAGIGVRGRRRVALSA